MHVSWSRTTGDVCIPFYWREREREKCCFPSFFPHPSIIMKLVFLFHAFNWILLFIPLSTWSEEERVRRIDFQDEEVVLKGILSRLSSLPPSRLDLHHIICHIISVSCIFLVPWMVFSEASFKTLFQTSFSLILSLLSLLSLIFLYISYSLVCISYFTHRFDVHLMYEGIEQETRRKRKFQRKKEEERGRGKRTPDKIW